MTQDQTEQFSTSQATEGHPPRQNADQISRSSGAPKSAWRFLRSPVFPDDDKTRTANFINAIVLSNIPVLAIFIIVRIATGSELFGVGNIILSSIIAILAVVWGMMRAGYVRAAGFLHVATIWVASTLIALNGSGVGGTGTTNYFVVMLMAGLLLGWRAALGFTFASILAIFGLAFAENAGILSFQPDTATGTAIEGTVLFVFGAIFLYLIISSLQRVAQAEKATSNELRIINKELTELRDALELRVEQRTTELASANQQSEKRAFDLQTIGEISTIISGEQKIETLLPLITRLVSERFKFYHVGIFLLDDTGQFAVLHAANSAGGQIMLARGHKLEVGTIGIVGYVAGAGEPRIALDVGADAVFFNNPDLPDTRSEMALPLISRGQIIGVLDVQSDKSGAFTPADAETLTILADQVAIAIENASLLKKTQEALAEAESLYNQYVRESWTALVEDQSLIGYQQSLSGGQKLSQPVESEEMRQAINKGRLVVVHADGGQAEAEIIIPVKLRGQTIGALKIKAPAKGRQWSQDEIDLAEAISERLSLALENARLFEETTRRAEREKMVTDITTRIRSTNDPQEMIKTAVQELQRALGATRVDIIHQVSGPSRGK